MKFYKSFYGKLSLVFLLVLLVLAVAQIFLTLRSSTRYIANVDQQLNLNLAKDMAFELKPLLTDSLDMGKIGERIHYMMVMNPKIEIYLLDDTGNILAFFVDPNKKVTAESVDLGPVHRHLNGDPNALVLGDDPRNAAKTKPFSAAPLTMGASRKGYLYIILGGVDYDSASAMLRDNYIVETMISGVTISFMLAGVLGLLLFFLLTRRFRNMVSAVNAFENGDLEARVGNPADDEIGQLATAFNQMADKLKANLEELKKTDNLRRELVANVSHDLRTPLTSIQGYLETIIIKDSSLSPEERLHYLEIIFKDTDHLNKMVHDLFELSKLDTLQIIPKPEPFSLAELTQDVAIKFKPKAEKCHVDLSASVQHELPRVHADIGMIERALSNLIDNAIDYTPENGRINIDLTPIDGKIRASVTDTGMGIPEADLNHIFDRFYQGKKDRLREKSGTGLGLAIAKKILELHKSDLFVESRENKGTRFFFDLDCDLDKSALAV